MHIGNRIFPYPVLNRNEALSDYKTDSIFKLKFEVDNDGIPIIKNGEIIFKNLQFALTDEILLSLLEHGTIKGAFIVECSASVYRNCFDINLAPYDLHIPVNEINGNVVVSCYLYAAEDIPNFRSMGFVDEYSNYSFSIDKFDILAVDDGFKFKIELDPSKDDKVASIFTVIKKESNDDLLSYDYTDKKINIRLPAVYYDCYENMKTKKDCNNISFAMIAIPALACCLEDISKRDFSSIDEIIEYYSWFNSICMGYKRISGNLLTLDDFENINKLELAQMVLNSATCNALKDFDNMLIDGMLNSEEVDDE